MGKKIVIAFVFFMCCGKCFCASSDSTSLKGMFIMQAGITPGIMFHEHLTNGYFHAGLEGFFEDRVSVRTDGYYFFTTQGDTMPLLMNHNILLGLNYHFPKKYIDWYIGIQPGTSIVKRNAFYYNDSLVAKSGTKLTPSLSATAGFNFFFWKYVNFFTAVNFIHSTFIPDYGNAFPLDEIRISAGLGWNYRIKHHTK